MSNYTFTFSGWLLLIAILLIVASGKTKASGAVLWLLILVAVGMVLIPWKTIGPLLVTTKQ